MCKSFWKSRPCSNCWLYAVFSYFYKVKRNFKSGVSKLVEGRRELLDSDSLERTAGSDALDHLREWLEIISTVNIVGAYVFERIAPGLQDARPAVATCSEELRILGEDLARRADRLEPVRPTQFVYYQAAMALSATSVAERASALSALDGMLKELAKIDRQLPLGDRLEFGHLSDWLETQRQLGAHIAPASASTTADRQQT